MKTDPDARLSFEPLVSCLWGQDDGIWETGCGHAFEFNDGDPTDNWFRFCPYCGKSLVVIDYDDFVRHLDAETQAWTDAASRGETQWICSDCGATFSAGMPDKCAYGHEWCTNLLTRDKLLANGQGRAV
jgi:hypothetical protein